MFDELTARRQANRGSRTGGVNAHPATLRNSCSAGMIRCGWRLFGTSRRNHTVTYYCPAPQEQTAVAPTPTPSTPNRLPQRETVLDAVAAFYAERLFGPRRRELLAAELAGPGDHARTANLRATGRTPQGWERV